jgi:hypothetical protein
MWETTRENCVAYLCGHPEMIEHCKEILKRRVGTTLLPCGAIRQWPD